LDNLASWTGDQIIPSQRLDIDRCAERYYSRNDEWLQWECRRRLEGDSGRRPAPSLRLRRACRRVVSTTLPNRLFRILNCELLLFVAEQPVVFGAILLDEADAILTGPLVLKARIPQLWEVRLEVVPVNLPGVACCQTGASHQLPRTLDPIRTRE
jgi:hypothetical protein